MRRNRSVFAVAAMSVVAVALLASAQVSAQRFGPRRGSPQARQQNTVSQPQPKLPIRSPLSKSLTNDFTNAPGDPVFPVYVDSYLTLDQATLALHQQMATALSGYATVPADRTNYFSALNNNPAFDFGYWAACIDTVQAVQGGTVVTVAVYPVFSNRASILTPNDYTEQYLVGNDGSITFQGSADPNGYAGQMPGTVDL